jgi:hypothetical protein
MFRQTGEYRTSRGSVFMLASLLPSINTRSGNFSKKRSSRYDIFRKIHPDNSKKQIFPEKKGDFSGFPVLRV